MKKIAFFLKPDDKSASIKKDFCDIRGVVFFDASNSAEIPDAVVCFGGDGTILRAVKYCVDKNVPLISINTGNLGFLSTFGPNDGEEFRKIVTRDSLEYDNVKLFSANISDSDCSTTNDFIFLNEVAVQRKISEFLTNGAVSIKLFIDGRPCQDFVADGVIVSSPFGSTAYSLSAGGSILSPDVSALIVTPICAHSHAYPIVLPDNCEIKIELGDKSRECVVCADGQKGVALNNNGIVKITASNKYLKVMRGKQDFYSRLNTKLLKWGSKNV